MIEIYIMKSFLTVLILKILVFFNYLDWGAYTIRTKDLSDLGQAYVIYKFAFYRKLHITTEKCLDPSLLSFDIFCFRTIDER